MTDEQILSLRGNIDNTVASVNKYLTQVSNNMSYHVDVIGETAGVSGNEDSQNDINSKINSCDLFVMILKNGAKVGPHTFNEYHTALSRSRNSANRRPLIKIYLLKGDKNEPVNISYLDELKADMDGMAPTYNFEDRVYLDSKRYIDIVDSESFDRQLSDYLFTTYPEEMKKFSQSEISYHQHISGTTQGALRNHRHRYFRRDNIDGKIEDVVSKSSLLILEGNVYSGKTRAAYEIMKQDIWKDSIFYVYRCNHDAGLQDLNSISFNSHESNHHKVILIDDINEVIGGSSTIDGSRPLWSELRSLSPKQLPQWTNTSVIITVAGRLSRQEKSALYTVIFGESYGALKTMLDMVTVNFDVYDRVEFKKMVNEMVREGILLRNDVRPGNYTIGSLFIDDEVIRNGISQILDTKGECMQATLRAISMNWKYANASFKGGVPELRRLYRFLTNVDERTSPHPMDQCLDMLRSRGFVFFSTNKVMIDSFVIDAINYVLGPEASDIQLLVDYAAAMMNVSDDSDSEHMSFNCVEKMGYQLCEKAGLDDDAIKSLVKHIYCKISKRNFTGTLDESAVTTMMRVICDTQNDLIYSKNFCATAAMRMSDFDFAYRVMMNAKNLIKAVSEKSQNAQNEDDRRKYELYQQSYRTLYKEIAYALISEQRHLNMREEELVLKEIFAGVVNGRKIFTPPFEESDLERVHILKRLIPHLERDIEEIIQLAEKARLDADGSVANSDSDDSSFELVDSGSQDEQIEKILLPQLRYVVVSAMKKTEDFNGFTQLVKRLCGTRSQYLQQALDANFAITFYYSVKDIVNKYGYEDRYRFFEYVVGLTDCACIVPHDAFKMNNELSEYASVRRIFALNTLLPLLDESDAMKAYYRMKDEGKTDGFTFSILLKNEFLSFEQLLHIASGEEGKYLIYNQLLGKAQTIDDAKACLRLMGISSADPSKLKDQYALGRYLENKYLKSSDCLGIVKQWRKKYPDQELNPITLGVIVDKMSFWQLKEIFEKDVPDLKSYGLTADEIMEIRRNAFCNHKLFYKANAIAGTRSYVIDRFDYIVNNNDISHIILDSRYNANTSILSVYLKNKEIFPTYAAMKTWWNDFYDRHSSTLKKTQYVYKSLLWKVQDLAKDEGSVWARGEINNMLIEAYNYFAEHYNKAKVVSNMAPLYNFILRIMNEEDINKELEYAYEGKIITCTLPEYLEHILNGTTAYADGTFVLFTLELMQKSVNDDVFDLISKIARKNRTGIRLDSLNHKDRKLSDKIRWRLLNINNGEIYVNKELISNFSSMKLLWWLLSEKQISYFDAKNYLERNRNINVTQSYLNMAFSQIYEAYDKRPEAYDEMKRLMNTYVTEETPAFYKSIQMFLPMIKASNSEEQLQETLEMFPENLRSAQEYVGAVMQKYVNFCHHKVCSSPDVRRLLDTLKTLMIENRDIITIYHVNIYLNALMQILRGDIRADFRFKDVVREHMRLCWDYMYDGGYVNVAALMNLNNEEWIVMSNVQTYIYFPMFDPMLPVYIDDLFEGNYIYAKNKDCLNDFIKNYSYFCADTYTDEAVEVFAKALERSVYKSVVRDFCANQLLHEKKAVTDFQLDLAYASPRLVKELYEYIKKGRLCKSKVADLINNRVRMSQLRRLFEDDRRFIGLNPSNIRAENKPLYDAIFNQK